MCPLPLVSTGLPARRASVLRRAVQTDDKGPATQFNNEELNAKLKETLADVQVTHQVFDVLLPFYGTLLINLPL